MVDQVQQVQIVVEAVNKAKTVLAQVEKDLAKMDKATQRASKSTKQLDRDSKKLTATQKKQSAATSSLVKRYLGAAGLIFAMRSATAIAAKQAIANTQLNAVLNSTAMAAGLTAEEVKKMASEFQNTTTFGDESILMGQNMLLTFTKIGKDVFPRATETMLDMAIAMNNGVTPSSETLRQTAIQLGKALNDPVLGATALRRVGVNLTEQQIEQIKTMVEMNDLMGAQKLILDELATEFGGSASRATENFAGKLQQSKNRIGDLIEIMATPFLDVFAGEFDNLTRAVEEDSGALQGLAKALGIVAIAGFQVLDIIGGLTTSIAKLGTGVVFDATTNLKKFADVLTAEEGSKFLPKRILDAFDATLKKTEEFSGIGQSFKDVGGEFEDMFKNFENRGELMQELIFGITDKTEDLGKTLGKLPKPPFLPDADIETLEKMEEEAKKVDKAFEQLEDRTESLSERLNDMAKDFQRDMEDSAQSLGNAFVEQEEKVKSLREELQKARQEGMPTKELEDELKKEAQALDDFAKSGKRASVETQGLINEISGLESELSRTSRFKERGGDRESLVLRLDEKRKALEDAQKAEGSIETQIAEARRRNRLTDFEREQEDIAKKEELRAEQFEKAQERINKELNALQEAFDEEKEIFEKKRDEFGKTLGKFGEMENGISTGADNITEKISNTANQLEVDFERIRAALERIKSVTGPDSGPDNRSLSDVFSGSTTATNPIAGNIFAPASGGNNTTNNQNINLSLSVSPDSVSPEKAEEFANSIVNGITRKMQLEGLGSIA